MFRVLLAKYTDALTSVNISDMVNKSKGELAYTIINTDHEIPASVVEKIEAMDTVIFARTF